MSQRYTSHFPVSEAGDVPANRVGAVAPGVELPCALLPHLRHAPALQQRADAKRTGLRQHRDEIGLGDAGIPVDPGPVAEAEDPALPLRDPAALGEIGMDDAVADREGRVLGEVRVGKAAAEKMKPVAAQTFDGPVHIIISYRADRHAHDCTRFNEREGVAVTGEAGAGLAAVPVTAVGAAADAVVTAGAEALGGIRERLSTPTSPLTLLRICARRLLRSSARTARATEGSRPDWSAARYGISNGVSGTFAMPSTRLASVAPGWNTGKSSCFPQAARISSVRMHF